MKVISRLKMSRAKTLFGRLAQLLLRAAKGETYAARKSGVYVGPNSLVYTHHFGTEPWLISIGKNTTVSSDVKFITHDGGGCLVRDENGRRYFYGSISIGDNCFVGLGALILPGVQIGDNCVVGAGSVVTKAVESGTVVAGNPARKIGTYKDYLTKVSAWASDEDKFENGDYRSFVNSVVKGKR